MKSTYVDSLVVPRLTEIGLDDELGTLGAERIDKLMVLWLRYGRVMNLTAAKTAEELAPHVIEAILAVSLARSLGVADGARWLDVGSGAGFPALVIAALMNVELTLIEPRERRASFLEVALAQIHRPSRVLRGHVEPGSWAPVGAETAAPGSLVAGEFDAVSARAVFPLERWLAIGATWANEEGYVFAHIPRGEEGKICPNPERSLGFDQWSVVAAKAAKIRNKWA